MMPPDALATRPDPTLSAAAATDDLISSPEVRTPHGPPTRRAAWSKYLAIFRVSLAERMTYRGDFLLGTILRFLPMVTTILLWRAIYKARNNRPWAAPRSRSATAR